MIRQLITLIILALISASPLLAQTGPGGVGNSNGTSSLEIWLTANDLDGDDDFTNNPASGTAVSTWVDKSGNLNNFTQTGTNRPSYSTIGAFNSINFDATVATSQFMNGNITGQYADGSVFFVINPFNSGTSTTIFDNSQTSLRIEQFNNSGVVGFTRYGVADFSSTISSVFGTNSIYSYHKTGASSTIDIHVNGTTQNLTLSSSNLGIPFDRIGKNSNGNDEASGDFFEVLLYSSRLNSAQTIIVENYLSAKYGSITIPTDLYNEDNVGAGNYDFNVAGIGRVDASNIHNDAQGTGIVRVLAPNNLGDNEFLIWGHDNGNLSSTGVTDLPVTIQSRLQRDWSASETGEVGTVTIRFDLSDVPGPITASDLRLLIDADGIYNSGAIISAAPTSLGSGIYEWTGIDIDDNDHFTVGSINNSQTPLPIELINFNAHLDSYKTVQLDWQTASEINNDYFTIERSQNGVDWEELNKIDGAGNSSSLLNYQSTDKRPYVGISYYRLKQTDFDGALEYSAIRSVKITSQVNSEIIIYPNPTNNEITVIANAIELEQIKVLNALGQDISTLTAIIESSSGMTIIDLSNLASGMYVIKTKTTANKVYKQ